MLSKRFLNSAIGLVPKRKKLNSWPLIHSATSQILSKSEKSNFAWVQLLQGSYKGVDVIHMKRPTAKNAISKSMLESLQIALNKVKTDNKSKVLIIRSDVKDVFCAGADLKERLKMPLENVPDFVSQLRQLVNDIATLPVPSIAALDGLTLGGGLEIALGCDIRVASLRLALAKRARLGLPETRLAIFPAAGGSQRLPRIVGIAKAKELIFTGKILSASEAEKIGLVNCITDEGFDCAYEKSLKIASDILKAGPCAVKLAKAVIDKGIEETLENGLLVEQRGYEEIIKTNDRNEALKAFVEKRSPNFQGC